MASLEPISQRFILDERARVLAKAGGRSLRTKAVLWSLGYLAYLTIGLLAGVGFLALGVYFGKMLLVVGGSIMVLGGGAFLVRAARAGSQPDLGRELTREEAPGLYDAVAEITGQLGIPAPWRIEVDGDLNASVFAYKVGLWRFRAVLRIGLPFLELLRPEEVRAVLAHECGHLARLDHVMARLQYRLMEGWMAGFHGQEGGHPEAPAWLSWFAARYWPRLQARLLAAARQMEEAADRVSLALVPGGAAIKVRAIVLSLVYHHCRDQYLRRLNEASEEVPQGFASRQLDAFRENWDSARMERGLRQVLHSADHAFDPHPTLARVLELGNARADDVDLGPPPSAGESTAAVWLTPEAWQVLHTEKEEEFRLRIGEAWKDNHARLRRARLQLQATADATDLVSIDLRVQAMLVLSDLESAAADLRHLAAERPKEADLARVAALAQAEADVPDADAYIRDTHARFPQYGLDLLSALESWHARRGDREAAECVWLEWVDYSDRAKRANNERAVLLRKEKLDPANMELEKIARLKALLRDEADVVEARLGRKRLSDFQDLPVHVLVLKFSGPARSSKHIRQARVQEILQRTSSVLGEAFVTSAPEVPHHWKSLGKISGATILKKG